MKKVILIFTMIFVAGVSAFSDRVFRDDREYEEYLKTIYKTQDSK